MLAHAAVRTLVLTIMIFNVTFGAAWSVLVLYSLERLDMGQVGFGLLTSAAACGGMGGTLASAGWSGTSASATSCAAGLIIETLTHLVLAVNTLPVVALAIVFFVFGAHAFVWGTISADRAPARRAHPMQGRVASVYMIGVTGGIVFGLLLGGPIAAAGGSPRPSGSPSSARRCSWC